jgi:hypothetical protein
MLKLPSIVFKLPLCMLLGTEFEMIRFLLAFGLFFLGTMSSVCLLWFEALRWLQSGHWPGWSLGGSLAPYIGDTSPFGAWLLDPQSWYGLHSVVLSLLKLPLPLWLFVSGLVLSSVFVKIEEEMVAAHKVKERKRRGIDEIPSPSVGR